MAGTTYFKLNPLTSMIWTLAYLNCFFSAKQNEIQEQYYAVEAKKGEMQRIIDDEGNSTLPKQALCTATENLAKINLRR